MVEEDAEEAAALSAAGPISGRPQSACLRFLLNAALKRIFADYPIRFHDRIIRAMSALAKNPRPPGCRKLSGGEKDLRKRVGGLLLAFAISNAPPIFPLNP